ncbi:MAG: ABC transporter ATP-binding protein [Actinomyces ruminicola]|uniref:ABC-2 type transport system ATP-binding protein n=1 Tax=Actinomyces ruminicola TaxID=332524 RepID=A0A1G9WVG4_9ACTO|nr:ABC transporter ATP-binding protein [Actinomyces ruminicola]MBE6483097.1 ABC transporter ATP-binding protein [Actinomyces ruminicola]SDM88103.1 ABC-2 type transport system ATP-binding protein [Actinomyces ruminicola]
MRLDFDTPVALENVGKRFGKVHALMGLDLQINAGGTVGLLGPNGSGKTTLLSLIAGLRRPSTGEVRLFGADPRTPEARVRLGVTPQGPGIVKNMSVLKLVRFVAEHFADHEAPEELLSAFGLDHLSKKAAGSLSGGQQRLLSVALAFVGRPRLVLLDEPSTGLDVTARRNLWDTIQERASRGVTILLTSHYLEEVQALSDRIVMIREGHVIADDDATSFVQRAAATVIRVTTADDRALGVANIRSARRDGRDVILHVDDASSALQSLADAGVHYSDIDIRRPSLEEAFAQLTTGEEVS